MVQQVDRVLKEMETMNIQLEKRERAKRERVKREKANRAKRYRES